MFYATKWREASLERFKKALPTVHDTRRQMWPGVHVEMLVPKQSAVRDLQQEQSQWLRELTMPVSMAVAFMVMCTHNKHRNVASRMHAIDKFNVVFHKIVALAEGLEVPNHPKLVTDADRS